MGKSNLSNRERLGAYIIPYYVFFTGGRWSFNKRLTREFEKKLVILRNMARLEKHRSLINLNWLPLEIFE